MGRSQEHNDRISEAIKKRYQDDPDYAELLSQSARRRWVREYNDEVNAVLDECEAGRLQRRLIIGLRAMKRDLEDGQISKAQKTLLRAVRGLMNDQFTKGDDMSTPYDAAHTPYVSETQARDHPEQHPHGHSFGPGMGRGRTPQSGESVSGMYGRQMRGDIGPAERAALKKAQLRRQEEGR